MASKLGKLFAKFGVNRKEKLAEQEKSCTKNTEDSPLEVDKCTNDNNSVFTELVPITCHTPKGRDSPQKASVTSSRFTINVTPTKTKTSDQRSITMPTFKQGNIEYDPALDKTDVTNRTTTDKDHTLVKDHVNTLPYIPQTGTYGANASSSRSSLQITNDNGLMGVSQRSVRESANTTHSTELCNISGVNILNHSTVTNTANKCRSEVIQNSYNTSFTIERRRSTSQMSGDGLQPNTSYNVARHSSEFFQRKYSNGNFGSTGTPGSASNSSANGSSSAAEPKKFKSMVGTRKSGSTVSLSSSVNSTDNQFSFSLTPIGSPTHNRSKSLNIGAVSHLTSTPENKHQKSYSVPSSSTKNSVGYFPYNYRRQEDNIPIVFSFDYQNDHNEGADVVVVDDMNDISGPTEHIPDIAISNSSESANNSEVIPTKILLGRRKTDSHYSNTLCDTNAESNIEDKSNSPAESSPREQVSSKSLDSALLGKSIPKVTTYIDRMTSWESTSVRSIETLEYDESSHSISPKPNRCMSPKPNSNYRRKSSSSLGFRSMPPVMTTSGSFIQMDSRRKECSDISWASPVVGSMGMTSSEHAATESNDFINIQGSLNRHSIPSTYSSGGVNISGREPYSQETEVENQQWSSLLDVLLMNRKAAQSSKGPFKYQQLFCENIQLLSRQFKELGYLIPKDIMAAATSVQPTDETILDAFDEYGTKIDIVTKEELDETAFLRLPLEYFCSNDDNCITKNIKSDYVSTQSQIDGFKFDEEQKPTEVNSVKTPQSCQYSEISESKKEMGSYSFHQHYIHKTVSGLSTPQRTPRPRSGSNPSCERPNSAGKSGRIQPNTTDPCTMFEVELCEYNTDMADRATLDGATEDDGVRVGLDYNDDEGEEFSDIPEGILATERLSTLSTSFSLAPLSYTTPSEQDAKLPGNKKTTGSGKNEGPSLKLSDEDGTVEKESSKGIESINTLLEPTKPPHLTAIDIGSYNGRFFCVIGDVLGRVEVLEGNEGPNWREKGRASHQIFFQRLKDRKNALKSNFTTDGDKLYNGKSLSPLSTDTCTAMNITNNPCVSTNDADHFTSCKTSTPRNSFDCEYGPSNIETVCRTLDKRFGNPSFKTPKRSWEKEDSVTLISGETLVDNIPRDSNNESGSNIRETDKTTTNSIKGDNVISPEILKGNYHSAYISPSESDRSTTHIYRDFEQGSNKRQSEERNRTSLLNRRCTHQAFVGAFDCLKSVTIDQQLRCIKILPPNRSPGVISYLAANEKTTKLFRIRSDHDSADGSDIGLRIPRSILGSNGNSKYGVRNYGGGGNGGRRIVMPVKAFTNAHQFQIQSLSLSADCETFLSLDDFQIYWWHIEAADTTKATLLENIKPSSEDIDTLLSTAAFHGTHNSLFLVGKSNGVCDVGDLRHPPCRSKRQYITSFVVKPKCHNAIQHSDHNDILSAVSSASFMGDNYVVTRDYLTMKLWDMRNSSAPAASCPVMGYVAQCIDSLYECDCIFDRFPLAVDDTSMSAVTGLYNGTVAVWRPGRGAYKNTQLPDAEGENDESIEKSPSYEDRDEDERKTTENENESIVAKRVFPSRVLGNTSDTISSRSRAYKSKTLKYYKTAIMSLADPYDEVEFYCAYPEKLEPLNSMYNNTSNSPSRRARISGYCSLSQVTNSTVVNNKESDTEYIDISGASTRNGEAAMNENVAGIQRIYPRITGYSQNDRVVNVSVNPGGERFAFTTNEHLFVFNSRDRY